MKILVVCQYYYPEQFQINEIAPELVRRGHEVTVLTGTPNYPGGEIFPGYENGLRAREVINGVEVIRVPIRPRGKGAVSLVLNYASFSRNAVRVARRLPGDYDVALCYQLSPVTMADPAVAYASKHHVPLVLYCLDIWPESALAHIGSKRNPAYQLVKGISKKVYQSCDSLAVTSRPFVDYLHDENEVPRERISYIPQHASDEYLGVDLSPDDDGVVDFMFAGNMGAGQTLDVLINAAAILRDRDDFRVHMVGDGSERANLERLAEELGVRGKVVFHGSQSRDDMPSFYKMADALLITLRGDNAVGNTMPGKLQTYMAAGKPIFGAINGAAREAVAEAECGGCVPAGDYEGLAELMLDYITDSEKYDRCGANAREFFSSNFTLDHFCDKLEELLEGAVSKW